jgi:DNA-binding CsgD family transcriptional regulator
MQEKAVPSWNLDTVAAAFAAAALDAGRWVEAMDVLAAETGSVGTALLPIDVKGAVPAPFSPSIASIVEPYISEGWMERDLRRRAIPHLMRNGVFSEPHYTTRDEIRRHPFFQEYLGPRGFTWSAVVLMSAADDAWAVSIQRHSEQDPFSPSELTKLQELSARLSAAAATAQAFGYARLEAALAAFETAGTAVLLLDRFARVVRLNHSAERMLGHGLEIVERKLRPKDPDAAKRFYDALRRVIWNSDGETSLAGPVALPRPGRQTLLAYLSRHDGISADILSPCQAIVTLVDPEQRLAPASAALRACYELTEAEARLAACLALGASLDQAAERFGISKLTARNQLASVMSKMSVHRQAELVAALAALSK